jgi:hypothetical protein
MKLNQNYVLISKQYGLTFAFVNRIYYTNSEGTLLTTPQCDEPRKIARKLGFVTSSNNWQLTKLGKAFMKLSQ